MQLFCSFQRVAENGNDVVQLPELAVGLQRIEHFINAALVLVQAFKSVLFPEFIGPRINGIVVVVDLFFIEIVGFFNVEFMVAEHRGALSVNPARFFLFIQGEIGHHVIGVDVSEAKVNQINKGLATIVEKDIDRIIKEQREKEEQKQ